MLKVVLVDTRRDRHSVVSPTLRSRQYHSRQHHTSKSRLSVEWCGYLAHNKLLVHCGSSWPRRAARLALGGVGPFTLMGWGLRLLMEITGS